MMLLVFLASFFIIEAYMEKLNPRVGHTTGIIVMMGILVSFSLHKIQKTTGDDDVLMEDLRFEQGIFFDLILPLIIFPSGYNMRRKKFFKNIGTIMKFGFIGTIFCFAIYTGLCYAALQ
jgi:sodium/hydrogen exchanger-like protein 6/7